MEPIIGHAFDFQDWDEYGNWRKEFFVGRVVDKVQVAYQFGVDNDRCTEDRYLVEILSGYKRADDPNFKMVSIRQLHRRNFDFNLVNP